MRDNFKGSLRILSSLVVLGFQLVIPQPSIEHRKVPQRIKDGNVVPEEESGGIPGVWGSWGPWSACSRSCSGGVMVQMRPCLPGYYYERPSHNPGQYSASGRALAHLQQLPQEDSLPPFSGHVISAIRTSVPLHRNEEPARAALSSSGGGHNESYWSRATSRGGQVSQSRRRSPKSERRGRKKSSIGPGKYGYGKVPYILPLQTDTGQSAHKPRKQRQSMQPAPNQQGTGGTSPFAHPGNPSHHHHPGGTYQGDHRSSPARTQVVSGSFYQQAGSHFQAFPAAPQSLFQGVERSRHLPGASHPAIQGQMSTQPAAAIVCTGAYKQYRLCNTNACLENRNIREVQCASYNNKPFMGRFYEWEPFAEVKGSQKCELNCRAVGYRFYVRQAEKVIDGTPCDQNGTSICVSGSAR